jgi:hemerythrin-like domain-containing protein
MRTYTDKIHHGKEEEIYFRVCAKKNMCVQESELLNELVEEHKRSRKAIEALAQGKKKYLAGEDVFELILGELQTIVEIYREHIGKEDHRFFPDSERYLSETEQVKMLAEFLEFDKKVIHEKYRSVVEDLAKQSL